MKKGASHLLHLSQAKVPLASLQPTHQPLVTTGNPSQHAAPASRTQPNSLTDTYIGLNSCKDSNAQRIGTLQLSLTTQLRISHARGCIMSLVEHNYWTMRLCMPARCISSRVTTSNLAPTSQIPLRNLISQNHLLVKILEASQGSLKHQILLIIITSTGAITEVQT